MSGITHDELGEMVRAEFAVEGIRDDDDLVYCHGSFWARDGHTKYTDAAFLDMTMDGASA